MRGTAFTIEDLLFRKGTCAPGSAGGQVRFLNEWLKLPSRNPRMLTPGPFRLDCNIGRRGIGVAVSGLLARRRAVDLSVVVTFGGNGRLHRQRRSYRNAEDGENCLSHGDPFEHSAENRGVRLPLDGHSDGGLI